MLDSYARLKVHDETAERYEKSVKHTQQLIEIPSHLLGSRSGGYRTATRTVQAVGTVEIEHYGKKRVEYGKVSYAGMTLLVVHDSTSWRAIEKKESKKNV